MSLSTCVYIQHYIIINCRYQQGLQRLPGRDGFHVVHSVGQSGAEQKEKLLAALNVQFDY